MLLRQALEDIGVNVASEEYLRTARAIAYSATLGTRTSYYRALKSLENKAPERVSAAWNALDAELQRTTSRPLLHQGVPLFPTAPCGLYGFLLLALAPIVLLAWLGVLWATGLSAGQPAPAVEVYRLKPLPLDGHVRRLGTAEPARRAASASDVPSASVDDVAHENEIHTGGPSPSRASMSALTSV